MQGNRTVVGVDTAKRVFQLHWVDTETGDITDVRLPRAKFLEHFANRAPRLIGMEACGGTQHWARRLLELGHDVRLLPAKMVRPFVRGNKNDKHDARAIWTAVQQPGIKTVAVRAKNSRRFWRCTACASAAGGVASAECGQPPDCGDPRCGLAECDGRGRHDGRPCRLHVRPASLPPGWVWYPDTPGRPARPADRVMLGRRPDGCGLFQHPGQGLPANPLIHARGVGMLRHRSGAHGAVGIVVNRVEELRVVTPSRCRIRSPGGAPASAPRSGATTRVARRRRSAPVAGDSGGRYAAPNFVSPASPERGQEREHEASNYGGVFRNRAPNFGLS